MKFKFKSRLCTICALSTLLAVGLLASCDEDMDNNDNLDRTLRLGGPEQDTVWHEEVGMLEIPLIFEGGVNAEKMMTGNILIDSLFGGCTNNDFTIENPDFSSAGNNTLKLKINIKDNENFGDWGFRISFKELKNVRAVNNTYKICVKDDERILGFRQANYEVEEGKTLTISTLLKGGVVQNHIPVSVEVVADGTTALSEQYRLLPTFNQIYEGDSTSNFSLKTYQHPIRENRVLKLKVTTTAGQTSPGKITRDDSYICNVTILNTDKSIGFGVDESVDITGGIFSIPLVSSGFEQDAIIYVKIKSSTLAAGECELVSETARIPAEAKSGSIQLQINKPLSADDRIVLEIEKVVLHGIGEQNDILNPDKLSVVCRLPSL